MIVENFLLKRVFLCNLKGDVFVLETKQLVYS